MELGAGALLTLWPISVLAGICSMLVFHWTGDRRAIRRAMNLVLAHLLEFRLFLDEPVVVLRAQWNLVRANLQLLRLMLIPGMILAIPSVMLFEQLDQSYGRAPLRVGEAVVVSAANPATGLAMPAGIVVETPPVHGGGEVAWRVRPAAAVSMDKVSAANAEVRIPFPAARILGAHWLVWFSIGFSIAAAGAACLL